MQTGTCDVDILGTSFEKHRRGSVSFVLVNSGEQTDLNKGVHPFIVDSDRGEKNCFLKPVF